GRQPPAEVSQRGNPQAAQLRDPRPFLGGRDEQRSVAGAHVHPAVKRLPVDIVDWALATVEQRRYLIGDLLADRTDELDQDIVFRAEVLVKAGAADSSLDQDL